MKRSRQNRLVNTPAKEGSFRSFREQRIHERKEIERDTRLFLYCLPICFVAVIASALYGPAFWDKVDSINPLFLTLAICWVGLLAVIKVMVGKKKMW